MHYKIIFLFTLFSSCLLADAPNAPNATDQSERSSQPIPGFSENALIAYKSPAIYWHKECKKLSETDLTDAITAIIDLEKLAKPRTWDFAASALNELASRVWAKHHTKEIAIFTRAIAEKSGNCYLDPLYAIEGAGLSENAVKSGGSARNTLHIYPQSKTAKKLMSKWKKSSTNISFSEYIRAYGSKKEKKELKKKSIRYLKPEEQEQYRVYFENGRVKINGLSNLYGLYMFALGGKNTILLAGIKKKSKFQHSSFFAGQAVKCAGKMMLENGKIVYIALRSGHYKPTKKHGDTLRAYLQKPENLGNRADKLKILFYKN